MSLKTIKTKLCNSHDCVQTVYDLIGVLEKFSLRIEELEREVSELKKVPKGPKVPKEEPTVEPLLMPWITPKGPSGEILNKTNPFLTEEGPEGTEGLEGLEEKEPKNLSDSSGSRKDYPSSPFTGPGGRRGNRKNKRR